MTQAPHQPTELELCDAIAEYLARHPDAADTVEGIASWWVPMQRIETEVAQVTRAVEVLVARGVLESVTVGPQCCYRLRQPSAMPPRNEGSTTEPI